MKKSTKIIAVSGIGVLLLSVGYLGKQSKQAIKEPIKIDIVAERMAEITEIQKVNITDYLTKDYKQLTRTERKKAKKEIIGRIKFLKAKGIPIITTVEEYNAIKELDGKPIQLIYKELEKLAQKRLRSHKQFIKTKL